MTQTYKQIERYYPLRAIYDPWYDTTASTDASNIDILQGINPLGTDLPLGLTQPHPQASTHQTNVKLQVIPP